MSELSYRYRAHPFARARTYRIGDESLIVNGGAHERAIRYADIAFIESFTVRFLGSPERYWRRVMHPADGPPVTLGAAFRDRWRLAGKTAEYDAFFTALHARIRAANPDHEWINGRHWLNRAGGLGGKLAVALIRLIRRTNPDRWANTAAWTIRRIGPFLRGHRRALEQLALAFPDKPPEELRRIAIGMWDNLARTAVEYAQLDKLWDYDPARPEQGRVAMDAASAEVLAGIKAANRPTLHFSLHSGNWELVAIAGGKYARCLIPYRRLKNPALTRELVRMRIAAGTVPLLAGPSIISRIRSEFGPGSALGMLIDQRYAHGIDVAFFGRPTKLNPLFARLARIYDCPVYGSRTVRLPGGRFRYKIVGPIEPKRDERGRIDVNATTQLFATMMESWIREHPEQWMWLHRAWR